LYDILQVENKERGTGTTVVWIPSQDYYSTITFILKMHNRKYFKNHKYIPRSRNFSRLYDIFQVEKGEKSRGLQWFDAVSGLLFDYNIYFENAHLENI